MNVRELWARLLAGFEGLSLRERALVGSALGILVLAIAFFGIVNPVLSLGSDAEQRVDTAEQQLRAMAHMRQEFDDVHHRLEGVESRIQSGSRGNLRTTIETLARQSGVVIDSMEPQASPSNDHYRETKVEVRLENVTLEQAVTYLHRIESHRQVLSVKTLRIRKRNDDSGTLDLNFTVSSFEPV